MIYTSTISKYFAVGAVALALNYAPFTLASNDSNEFSQVQSKLEQVADESKDPNFLETLGLVSGVAIVCFGAISALSKLLGKR